MCYQRWEHSVTARLCARCPVSLILVVLPFYLIFLGKELPGAGLGLYAGKKFVRGELITAYGGIPLNRGQEQQITHVRSVDRDGLLDGYPLAQQFDRSYQHTKLKQSALFPSIWLPIDDRIETLLRKHFTLEIMQSRRQAFVETIDLTQTSVADDRPVRPRRRPPLTEGSPLSQEYLEIPAISAASDELRPLIRLESDRVPSLHLDAHSAMIFEHYCCKWHECDDNCLVETDWCRGSCCVFQEQVDSELLPMHCSTSRVPCFVDQRGHQNCSACTTNDWNERPKQPQQHLERSPEQPSKQTSPKKSQQDQQKQQQPMTIDEQHQARTLSHLICHSGCGYLINDPLTKSKRNCRWDKIVVGSMRKPIAVIIASCDIEPGEELYASYNNQMSRDARSHVCNGE